MNTSYSMQKESDLNAFKNELFLRINMYFKDSQISKYANLKMFFKLMIACVIWPTSCYLLFSYRGENKLLFFCLYLFHFSAQLFILLNIAHDANHYAIFKNKFLSKVMTYSFDLCGVSSYMWRELHHAQHHTCINIDGEDETLVARNLFRFTKNHPKRFLYRFQHFYFLFFYGFFTADWVFFKDFECFFFPYTNYLKTMKHPGKEYVKLFLFKIVYIGYMIVLPAFITSFSVVFIIFIFLACHFVIGLIGGTVIQITHPLATAEFPASKADYPNFASHVFATTADYSVNSKIAEWFFGGLHLHVIHHLCPNICHVHYNHLTIIVKEVAQKYQVNYRVNRTMLTAIKDHYHLLKSLSK